MKAKIKVTFEMSVADSGEFNTQVKFDLLDHPEVECPPRVKKLVVEEIRMLCGAMLAAEDHLFTE